MSSTGTHTVSQHRLRGSKLLTVVTVLGLLMTTLVQTGFGTGAPEAVAASGPFTIDGALVPDVGAAEFQDPFGSVKELGPANLSTNKLFDIHGSPVPMLGFTDVPGKSDLSKIWLDVQKDGSGDQWLYFAWEREDTNGATVVLYEFQQSPIPNGCDYAGVDQVLPSSGTPTAAQQTLIDNCNPWSGRSPGDFMIVFDFGGSSIDIKLRTWNGSIWSSPVTLDVSVSEAALNTSTSKGEGAVNLTATIFDDVAECLSIANILPGTITGNSDNADYKDTVLADFSDIFISNCGAVEVTKVTDPVGATDNFDVALFQRDGGDVNYDGDSSLGGTLMGDGGIVAFPDLLEDSDYVLDETNLPPGWMIRNIDVVGQNSGYDPATDNFGIVAGETTFVMITNFKLIPSYTITKSVTDVGGDGPGGSADEAGDVIDYEITVTNTGNQGLTNVVVSDPLLGALTGPSGDADLDGVLDANESLSSFDSDLDGKLDVAETWTYTGSYTVSQADIDANGVDSNGAPDGDGDIDNTASVVSTEIPTPQTASASVPVVQSPSILLDKSGTLNDDDGTPGVSAGDTISYAFTVTNTGNVTLTNVTLADTVGGVTINGGPIATLAIDAVDSTTFTGSYSITQADIDAGHFFNTATVTGIDPNGDPTSDDDDHDEGLAQLASILLDKSGTLNDDDGTPGVSAGDTISYAFTVTNTGNVTLTNVTLADTIGGVTISGGPIATLGAGASDSSTFTGSYTLTQIDVDAGTFTNTATATGTPPSGPDVSDPDDDTQTLAQDPSIDLIKTGTLNDDDGTPGVSAGDTISYAFTITNDGNVTLANVTLADTIGGVTISGGPIATLGAGASDSSTFTGSYTLTQADVDAGTFTNTATATGTPPSGPDVSDPDDDTQNLAQDPSIDLVKSGTLNDDDGTPGVSAGDTISYAFTITNTGNVTLANVTLADTVGGVTISGGPIVTLAVGASDNSTFTGTYTLTQDDVDAGTFTNTATATGTPPIGPDVSDPDDDTQLLAAGPSIDLIKTGTWNDANADGFADVGETISYSFTVTNDGNVTLTNVTLADTIGGVTISGGPIASLAVDEVDSTTFTGSYSITQADIDAGNFFNTATATGIDPNGDPVDDDDDHDEDLAQDPSIDLVKTGTLNDDDGTAGVSVGDTISYAFTITNTGNVTLTNVTLADTVGGVTISGGPIATLGVGGSDSTTFSGSYTLTQDDVDAGSFTNTATATGTPPIGPDVSDPDDDTQTLAQDPSIDLIKTGTLNDDDGTPGVSAGDTISYAFTITNDGNVTLTNVTLADTIGGVTISGGPIGTLAVGASDSTTFTGTYTLTQADVDAATFTNTATATGTPPSGPDVSDPDDDTQTLTQDPSIDLVKSGTLNDDDGTPGVSAGDTISYAFTVTNDGNVTLTNVTLADTVGGVTISGGPIATLAVDAVDATTFTGTYTLTQADVDAATFTNTATATGTPPIGPDVSDPDDDVQPLAPGPSIDLVKTGVWNDENNDGFADAGETISYSFTVTNDGNVTLTNVVLADTIGGVTISGGPIASLAVDAVDATTFTGTYTLTQVDVDAGVFENLATATGTPPSGPDVSDPDNDVQDLVQGPSILLVKTGTLNDDDGTAGVSAGDTISYAFTVTNDGNVTLTNVTLADTVGGVTISGGPIATLAVGASDSTTFTGTYTLTQADVDAATFTNTATATGTPPSGPDVSDPDDDTQDLAQTPSIDLVKTGTLNDDDGTPGVSAGDTISYAFTVANTGNVTLTNVTLADTIGGVTISGDPIATLAVGASDGTTFTGTYTLTQADVDAGTFTNTATATGTPPIGPDVSDPDDDTQPLTPGASIDLVKTGTLNDDDGTAGVSAGDTISYAFTVTNDGNVTLTNVTLADTVGGVTISGDPIATLAVGASDDSTFTGTYTLTQADVDAGIFTNTATATGTPPSGPDVSDPDDDTQTLAQDPSIDLVKTGTLNDDDGTAGVSAGDTISYAFTVTNDGNVTLTNVTLADTVGGVTISGDPIATLAVGASDGTTFTGTYTLTQADVDAGTFTNTATATGTPPSGPDVSDPDDDTQTLAQDPSIMLLKTGTWNDGNNDGFADAGETISYAFTVTNDGNVTLTNVTLADTVGGVTISGDPIATLAVGASDDSTFTGTYTLTQADVDAGIFTNTATATGTPPSGPDVSDPDDDTQTLTQDPSIDLVKTGTLNDDDGTAGVSAGDTISYAFTVTNDGNVTLTNVTLADTVGGVTISGDPIATLAVGASDDSTFTGTYTLTQADVDAGIFTNTATATGTPPSGPDVSDPDDDTQTLAQDPSIMLLKTGTWNDGNNDGFADAGETISYAFTVTNDGNVTLTNVTLADTVGGVTISGDPIATLAVGASDDSTFTGTYTLTQADVDAGIFTNTATATGTPPSGPDVSDPDDDTQTLTQDPSIDLVKTGTLNDDDGTVGVSAGDTITYAFTVTNTGNVTLTNVTLADTVGGVTISGGPIATLAVGASDSTTFTGSYTLTQADVNAGLFENMAIATGTPPIGEPVTDDDDDVQELAQDPSILLDKVGTFNDESGDGYADAGETISYAFTITNDGNVTLTNVTLADTVGGVTISGGPIATLAVGDSDSTTFTGSYTLTQTDIAAGVFENLAIATGTPPIGEPVTDDDNDIQELEQRPPRPPAQDPSVEIIKTGTFNDEDVDGLAAAGETITYMFKVTNTGNVTLDDVTVTDVFDAPSNGTSSAIVCNADNNDHVIASMAPGAVVDCSSTYTLTQADIDSGGVANVATASGTDPGGEPVVDSDEEEIDLPANADVAIVKTVSTDLVGAGNSFDWILVVTNSGPATAVNVVVGDIVPNVFTVTGVASPDFDCSRSGNTVTCTADSMEIGETGRVTITVSVPLTAEGGTVVNIGTVEADTPDPDLTNNSDDESVVIVAQAAPTTTLPPVTLPPTGSNATSDLVWAALLLVMLGAGVVLITRRRRDESEMPV